MYNNIVKTAKNIIAKNQAKKLLEYFKNEATNGLTNDQIELLKQKIVNIQKQTFNFPWFVHRFIQQKKHYQDIDPLLKIQQAYKKLNKELRTFQFKNNKSFSDFNEFMEDYLNKNVKNQEFNAPSYCKLIHSDGKYNYYYADADDTECYWDLHYCNTKQDGSQYAMWCVVNGTVSWGRYTDAEFPFYVYVTYKNNIPVMLFNFGYDQDAQIKDIHDDPFTKYDQELLNSIKQLAKKYNFDIAKNEDDFKTFNKIDKLYNKSLDELNIDQKIISESNKYNGLNFIQQNIIYDFKKNQKAYLIANDNIVNLQGYKINLYLLNLLKDKDYINSIAGLANNNKFLSSCSQQIFTFIIQVLIDKKQYNGLNDLIIRDKIKDENQVKEIVQILIVDKQYEYLYNLIQYNKIKDENKVKEIIQVLIDNKEYKYLYELINYDKIKDENQLKYSIQGLIDEKQYDYLCRLIRYNRIKDENIIKYTIQGLIDEKQYYSLRSLIERDKIKDENKVKEIIQVFIDKKQVGCLCDLIIADKIKDENIVKQIIQVFIDNKQHYYLYSLIERDKIKDENLMKQSIQVLINEKVYEYLYELIKEDKIKDENQFKQSIQVWIEKEQYKYLYYLIDDDQIKDKNILKQSIQGFIDGKKYNYLYGLIKNDKIKDENIVKQIIQVFIDNKQHYYLYRLIENDKIKDENIVKQIVQVLINEKAYEYLYELIEKNKINQSLLTQEQKELLKKENPNFKLSKKLINIAKILKG